LVSPTNPAFAIFGRSSRSRRRPLHGADTTARPTCVFEREAVLKRVACSSVIAITTWGRLLSVARMLAAENAWLKHFVASQAVDTDIRVKVAETPAKS
jgi:hypothetical protein